VSGVHTAAIAIIDATVRLIEFFIIINLLIMVIILAVAVCTPAGKLKCFVFCQQLLFTGILRFFRDHMHIIASVENEINRNRVSCIFQRVSCFFQGVSCKGDHVNLFENLTAVRYQSVWYR